jgi:Ca2+-binding RTX toxin-like protein
VDAGETATLTVTAPTSPNGTFALNGAGTAYVFTPNANFNGTANISYRVVDTTGVSIAASQSVTVSAVNDAPALTAAPAILTPATEDTPYTLTIAQMLQGYTDVDAGETATLTVTAPTSPNGTFALNGAGTAYVFTPNANFNGTANISYGVVDTTGVRIAASQSFTVNAVNDAPILDSNSARTILEDAAPTALNIVAPYDVEGDPLTIVVTGLPDSLIGNVYLVDGTPVVNGQPLTAAELTGLIFTPELNANGVSTFSYSVFDGAATSSQTISLGVTAVNDAPLIETVIDPTLPTINEDTLAPTSGIVGATIVSDLIQAGYGLGNYADPDDPTAAVPGGLAITGVNSNGTLYFSTNSGNTWQSVNELSDSNALILDINSYLFFQPNADYNGGLTDALTFRGWDGTGGYANGSRVNTIESPNSSFSVEADGIGINIIGVNDAPRLNANTTINLLEDAAPTSLNITAPFDPENDALTIKVTGLPNGSIGKVYLAGGETLVEAGAVLTPGQLTGLVFIPKANAFGIAGSFSYSVSDGSLASTQSISFNVEAVNDPLVGSPTAVLPNGNEDQAYTVSAAQLLMGFSDVDVNDAITLSTVSADHGTVTSSTNGQGVTTYTITPNANYNGLVTLTYNVLSGPDSITGAQKTFTLNAVNDPLVGSPTAVLGNGTEDTAYVVNAAQLLMGFSDIDVNDASNPNVITLANVMANHGTISTSINAESGETIYTITPEANYNGLVTLTYDVISGPDTITGAQQTFTLNAVNDPLVGSPTAVLPNGTEDISYTVTLAALLAGFSDIDTADTNNPNVIRLGNFSVDHGTFVLNEAGTAYIITPNANYNGLVTLVYDVISGSDTITGAQKTFTLNAVNDPLVGSPTAVLGNGTEDTAYVVNATQLLTGFSDVDVNDASNPNVITLANVIANHGTVSTSIDAESGATIYTITPEANYNGPVTLTYDVISGSDTISSAQQTFTLASVNDAPVVQGSKTISLLEDSTATALGISAPTDVDGPSQTITVTGLPNAAIGKVYLANGTTLVTNNQILTVAQLTSLVFKPGLNANGSAGAFTYVVNDGIVSSSQSINFNVTAVNDRPLLNKLASPVLNTVLEDTVPTNGSTAGSTQISSILQKAIGLNNFSDPDADNPGGVAIVNVSNQGTLYVSTNNGATWTAAVGVSSANALIVGINDRILFAPAANYNGSINDAISFKSWDGHGPYASGNYVDVRYNEGGFTSTANSVENAFSLTVDTAALSVTSVNDAPTVAPNKSLTANEDTRISLNITAPSDVDGTVASITVTGVPTSSIGKVYLANGTTLVTNNQTLTAAELTGLVFVPSLNANGPAGSFSYEVSDGLLTASQTITLGVTPVNDPISGAPTTTLAAGTEDQPYTVTVAQLLAGFSDPDTADATNPNVINVGSISADHGTVVSNGEGGYTITPAQDYNGLVTLTYSVTSGPDTFNATQTFNLAAVNDAPVVDSSKSLAVLEDTLTPLAIVAPTDVDGGVLAVAIDSLPTNGVLYLAGGETPVSLTDTLTATQLAGLVFLPAPNFFGSGGTFSYTVSDGTVGVSSSVSLSITSVNDAPVLGTIAAPKLANILEDATPVGAVGNKVSSIVQIGSGLANFADPDGTLPAGIAVTGVNPNGTLYYSTDNGTSWTAATGLSDSNALVLAVTARVFFAPNANFNGAVSNALTFRAWDGFAHSSGTFVNTTTDLTKTFSTDSDTISINIAAVNNDAPMANDDTVIVTSRNARINTSSLLSNDVHPDGTAFKVVSISSASNSSMVLNDNGTPSNSSDDFISYSPTIGFGYSITDTFTYTVQDTAGLTDTAAVTSIANIPAYQGTSGDDTIEGTIYADIIYGNDGNDYLYSHTGSDHLYGGAGNDVLESYGNPGTITLEGGANDDIYGIYDSADIIIENAGGGTDTVWTAVNYTLADNVENMYLVGSINGAGNSSDNKIAGYGIGDNLISGGDGNDTIDGGAGNDTIYGNDGNDALYGGDGNDVLDSYGAGLDTLAGGSGDDVYGIYNSANIIIENAGGGTDTVWTAVNYTLADNVENMYLVGSINGTGNSSDNTIAGYGVGDNIISGGDGNDTIDGGAGNDTIYGNDGNDALYGGDGNDVLDSYGAGLDTLAGGSGDDVYDIYNSADLIIENAGGGTDTVRTAVNYTLADNVENMYLVGSINGAGNSSDNTISGYGVGNNIISGGDGNDTIDGGAGNDTIYGNDGNDALYGGEGNDVLDSYGAGLDTLAGGSGDDVYGIYNSADLIIENAGGGTDSVWTAVNYTLADNVESMYLVGSINGTGNSSDNTIAGYGVGDNIISGGDGNDTIDGGAGNDTIYGNDGNDALYGGDGNDVLDSYGAGLDTLAGGSGDDVYGIYNSANIIIENAGGGTDSVWTAVNYTLADNVENMYLVGSINGTGNSSDNTIVGYESGNNIINGGAGNDYLDGGAGSDTFEFGGSSLTASQIGVDTIASFNQSEGDKLYFSSSTFGLIGNGSGNIMSADLEVVANDNAALTSSAKIIYSQGSGNLFFNTDASTSGFGAGGQFAVLANKPTTLLNTDISIF